MRFSMQCGFHAEEFGPVCEVKFGKTEKDWTNLLQKQRTLSSGGVTGPAAPPFMRRMEDNVLVVPVVFATGDPG